MNRAPHLNIEALEDRSLPSAAPWAAPGALTVSLAPDKTAIGPSGTSALFKTLNAVAPQAVWQAELARAFQTWAAAADVSFGLVKDGGQAFGTPGDIQGDTRFGDVRIGAAPLVGSLANTAVPGWGVGTWSGDITLNSLAAFAVNPASPAAGADLYTVALHEIGHSLGLGESDDPASAMYRTYVGTRAGLSAADVAAVRALYGVRTADRYEGVSGNGTLGTATALGAGDVIGLAADVTAPGDADVYALVPQGTALKVRVAAAGVSLLRPDVAVYDAAGVLVARKAASDPLNGDVALDLKGLTVGATYYVRVAAATADGFGRYRLSVAKDLPPDAKVVFEKDGGTNNTPQTAGALTPNDSGTGGTAYAVLEGATDADWYRVQSPAATDGGDQALVVRVFSLNTATAVPELTVLDDSGAAVPYAVLARDAQTLTVQVLGVRRAAEYRIGVTSPAGVSAGGNYRLTADFHPPTGDELTQLMNGQLGGGAAGTATGTLVVAESRLFQFDLTAASAVPVTLTVRDTAGKVLLTLTLAPGEQLVGAAVYLGPGAYTVAVAQVVPKGQTAPPATYGLYAGVASDPIGTLPTTTTQTTTTPTATTTSVSTAPAYFYTTPTVPLTMLGMSFTF